MKIKTREFDIKQFMKTEEKMKLLEQVQKNNDELVNISYKLIDIARNGIQSNKRRNDFEKQKTLLQECFLFI